MLVANLPIPGHTFTGHHYQVTADNFTPNVFYIRSLTSARMMDSWGRVDTADAFDYLERSASRASNAHLLTGSF